MPDRKKISFSVDSELLRELGERLVGRQYIALAELVKNSFDADATKVEIHIQDDCIEVADNGHGMTFQGPPGSLDASRVHPQVEGGNVTGIQAPADRLKGRWASCRPVSCK